MAAMNLWIKISYRRGARPHVTTMKCSQKSQFPRLWSKAKPGPKPSAIVFVHLCC